MNTEEFKVLVSEYATNRQPFFFMIDFECNRPFICKLDDAALEGIYYDIKGESNIAPRVVGSNIKPISKPIQKDIYFEKIELVKAELNNGNSYLVNLTFPSEIELDLTLSEIFHKARAQYKLLFKDEFVVFSPECFIKIVNDEIFTYPMKGTINANIENAKEVLMGNKKEEWEHNTVVDLMRNDISMIASNIEVLKYRYVEIIKTHKGEILQTSSEIKGQLASEWRKTLGEDLIKLLPAGSISGAPKQKTIEIIRENELIERGYYTGIFGIYDGTNLDSAVSIRFIENNKGKKLFRSGGGITSHSSAEEEYNELIHKIYVPTF